MSARSDLRENVFWTPPGGKNKPISSKSYCSTSTSHQSNVESIMFFIYKKMPHLPFIGPKSCAVAMNLNLSGVSSVGSSVLMCKQICQTYCRSIMREINYRGFQYDSQHTAPGQPEIVFVGLVIQPPEI